MESTANGSESDEDSVDGSAAESQEQDTQNTSLTNEDEEVFSNTAGSDEGESVHGLAAEDHHRQQHNGSGRLTDSRNSNSIDSNLLDEMEPRPREGLTRPVAGLARNGQVSPFGRKQSPFYR